MFSEKSALSVYKSGRFVKYLNWNVSIPSRLTSREAVYCDNDDYDG